MRVNIYTLRFNPISGGGSHHSLEIFIRALRARGHIPVLTTFFSDDNNFKERPCEMREERFTGGFVALQRRIARLMHEEKNADVHVVFGPTVMWGGGMYRSEGGAIPVVACLNNYTPGMGLHRAPRSSLKTPARLFDRISPLIHTWKWYAWEHIFGIRYVRAINRAFFSSPVVVKEYEKFGYRFRDTVIIPEPIEAPHQQDLPSPFSNDTKVFNVLFAGRLIADKGPDLLVKAAIGLPGSIHIHLIGTGNEEQALRSLIKDNGLEQRVHLYGWKNIQELPRFYSHAHVFVNPCRWPEPFGRVVADAMSHGAPIVSTEGSGSAWAAGDGGITFKNGDVADLRRCILYFFNNPEARAEYARKAAERVRIFDAGTVGGQFVDGLESLAKFT